MPTVELPVESRADANTDIGVIWKEALDRFEKITMVKIESLAGAANVDDILNEIHERETSFKDYRHDGSKLDKFKTLVSKSLDQIDKVVEMFALPVSTSFPPSMAIFTVVRFLISTANSVSADYDKIIEFFEDVDSYLNRLKILEKGVPSVPELKVALTDVLTSVLVLCGICAKYVKMKRFVKSFRSLVSGEDDELKAAYAHFHKMVEQEHRAVTNATLVVAEQLKGETRSLHADVRGGLAITEQTDRNTKTLVASTGRLHTFLERRAADFEREKILRELSSLNFHDKQRDIFAKHHPCTGQWLLETEEFRQWFESEENSALWGPGIPGAGKTVMTSIAVNYVVEATRGTRTAIAYVYCDYQDPKTQSEVELLCSITRQLAEQTDPLPPEIKEFQDKSAQKRRNPTNDERISLVRSMCLLFQKTYIFIDALDEFPETNREKFLRSIKKLEPFVGLFITSRPHLDLRLKFTNISRIDISARDSDIEAYLKSEISANYRVSKFAAKDPKLTGDIIKGVNEKSAGMFLLAHLQMERLCSQTSLRDVRRTINALSTKIYATYEDAMTRIEDQSDGDCHLAKRALSYIFCARRPLKVEELRHALSVEPEDTELDETALPETEILLNVSAGLIRMDEKSSTLRLVHYTLREYLETNRSKLLPNPEAEIAKICLTYLSFDVFESGPCGDGDALHRRLEEYRFLDYASHNWGYHVMGDQLHGQMDLISTYLENESKFSCFVQVSHVRPNRTHGWHDRFPRQFGPLHVVAYWGLEQIVAVLFAKNIDINGQDSYGATALQLAAKHGHKALVQLLLEKGADVNTVNNNVETALSWAARNGHKEVVELLLSNGATVMTKDSDGWTALDWAVVQGYNEVVKILLEHGIDIEAEADGRNKALLLAAEEGHEVTVQMLLDNGANVNWKDDLGSGALAFAVPGGHEATVRVLLWNGANVHSTDICGQTALHYAVPLENEATMRLLLENGADANVRNEGGQTALFWTAQDGLEVVAKLLLEYNADINAKNTRGFTALHVAALRGREAMVRFLLDNGANAKAMDEDEWTPLHVAALKGHEEVVQVLSKEVDNEKAILDLVTSQQQDPKKRALIEESADAKAVRSNVVTGLRYAVQESQLARMLVLLGKGADVNARDTGGWTALTVAASHGYNEEAVRLLLENGADVNMRGYMEWPALHWAAAGGKEAVVQLLVENGADVKADRYSWTAMLLAAKNGYTSVVRCLVKNGAAVNAEDYHGRTVLHWTAKLGDSMMARLLTDRGANVNAMDRWGKTPLIWAVEHMQQAVANLLLESGANVEVKTRNGLTALHLAAVRQNETMVQRLLEGGSSIEAKTGDDATALHLAALTGCEEVVRLLLVRGADVRAEAQGRRAEDHDVEDEDGDVDEEGDGTAAMMEARSLSKLLRQLLHEREAATDIGLQTRCGLIARDLAVSQGHTAVQRLLESHNETAISDTKS